MWALAIAPDPKGREAHFQTFPLCSSWKGLGPREELLVQKEKKYGLGTLSSGRHLHTIPPPYHHHTMQNYTMLSEKTRFWPSTNKKCLNCTSPEPKVPLKPSKYLSRWTEINQCSRPVWQHFNLVMIILSCYLSKITDFFKFSLTKTFSHANFTFSRLDNHALLCLIST